ncbi:unnamed protein product, partial [Gulo gulo]
GTVNRVYPSNFTLLPRCYNQYSHFTGTPKLRAGSPVTGSLRKKHRQGIIGSSLANGLFLPRAGHGSSANIRQASPGQLVTGVQAASPHLPTHGSASSS